MKPQVLTQTSIAPVSSVLRLVLALCAAASSAFSQNPCGGTLDLPLAGLPLSGGACATTVSPSALVAPDTVVPLPPGAQVVEFARCDGTPGSSVAMVFGGAPIAGAIAGWPAAGVAVPLVPVTPPTSTQGGPWAPAPTGGGPAPCGGVRDFDPSPLPHSAAGPGASEVGPFRFQMTGSGGGCHATGGRVLGVVDAGGTMPRTMLFTSGPSIDVINGGAITSSAAPGSTAIIGAGTSSPVPIGPQAAMVTSGGVCVVGGMNDATAAFPNGASPRSAALIGRIFAGLAPVDLAVETTAPGILVVSLGVATHHALPGPVQGAPMAFSDGVVGGVVVFTAYAYHMIVMGQMTTTALNAAHVAHGPMPGGIAVLTANASNCFPTNARVVGAIDTQIGTITELCVWTNAPGLQILSGGVLNTVPVQGAVLHAGGLAALSGSSLSVSQAYAITDTHINTVSAGTAAAFAFPAGAVPVSAGAVATCGGSGPGGIQSLTLIVETTAPGLTSIGPGGPTTFSFPAPLAARPMTWTNGAASGVLAATSSTVYGISGGAVTTYPLGGAFVVWNTAGSGVVVTTTSGSITIPLGAGATVKPFASCDGGFGSGIAFNTGPCSGVGGTSCGWTPGSVQAAGGTVTAVDGGPFQGTSFTLDVEADTDSNGGVTVALTGVPSSALFGITAVTDATPTPAGQGPVFGITPSPFTFLVLNMFPNPTPGLFLHWAAGYAGVFPQAPAVLPAGSLAPFVGQTWDFVAFAFDANGLAAVSNVARVTW